MATDHMVALDGVDIHCRIDGDDAALSWIVFGNSLMTDLRIWDRQVAALAGRCRVLRYDQRGHGGSTATSVPLDFNILGQDLLALLDWAKIYRCIYVGLSMGVPTGLAAYGSQPGRFARLVFVDGQARTAETGAASWEERIELARAQGMAVLADQTMRRWLQPQTADSPMGAALTAMILATPLEGFIRCARALQNYDFLDVVQRITCPLLAIVGALDGVMPKTMQQVFGSLPGARFVEIPNAGHLSNYEQPEAFNAQLLSFLDAKAQ
jgi:3-oxoadipate enol-lactonase